MKDIGRQHGCSPLFFYLFSSSSVLQGVIFMLVVCIYAYWCPTRFPCLAVTLLVEQELLTPPDHMRSPAVFIYFCCRYGISKKAKIWNRNCFPFQNTSGCFRSYRSLVFCVVIVGHCMSFLLWSMYCLSFDSCLQIAPLVSSNCLC